MKCAPCLSTMCEVCYYRSVKTWTLANKEKIEVGVVIRRLSLDLHDAITKMKMRR